MNYLTSQCGDKFVFGCVGTQPRYINSPADLKAEGALGGVPRRYITFSTLPKRDAVVYMAMLMKEGSIRIPVDSVFDIEDVVAAYERVSTKCTRDMVVSKVWRD
ncbi:hypothetical protein F1880_004611 [Penicillium rolfsii]|nr:hypothetical protein F1880_004611 [Penicillium rolfsii]